MQQGFGQTENSAMTLLPKEDIQRKMGSIGKPGFLQIFGSVTGKATVCLLVRLVRYVQKDQRL